MADKNSKEDKNNIYSYHTFIFPFYIRNSKKEYECRVEKLISDDGWEKSSSNDVDLDDENKRLKYAQAQYFYENVRRFIYDFDKDGVVKNFYFKKNQRELKYKITSFDKKEYELNINNIKLKIVNNSLGILIFECENNKYRSLDDVKIINDLGRRIVVPFMGLRKNEKWSICAKNLEIFIDDKKFSESQFNFDISKIENLYDTKVAQFIKDIIFYGNQNKNNYSIIPAVDDRMYTCCIVIDNDSSKKITGIDIDNLEFSYRDEIKSIYEFIYIDPPESCSAPTKSSLIRILRNSIYDRWIKFGTLYGISHSSLVAITSTGVNDTVVNPFLTQYIEMSIIVLVQRAKMIYFKNELTKNNNLKRIQQEYISYMKHIHFLEVTPQEQGIELYQLLQKQLFISQELENLEQQLTIIYERNDVEKSENLQEIIFIFAIITNLLTIWLNEHSIKLKILVSFVVMISLYILYIKYKLIKKFLFNK